MVVEGSRLVAKVEEALQHRTRTIDFTLSAINRHARVPRGSHDAARPPYVLYKRRHAKYNSYNFKSYCTDTMEEVSHGAIRVGVG